MNRLSVFFTSLLLSSSACTPKSSEQSTTKNTDGKPASADLQDASAFFYLHFDAESDELAAYAGFNEFREGSQPGTALKLADPAKISFDGAPMEYKGVTMFTPGDYVVKQNITYSGVEHQFLLTRGDGKTFQYLASLPAPLDVLIESSSLSISKGISIRFSRSARDAERIECGLSDKSGSKSFTWTLESDTCDFSPTSFGFDKLKAGEDYLFAFYVHKPIQGLDGAKDVRLQTMYIGKKINLRLEK